MNTEADNYTFKKIRPFEYKSREEYKKRNTSIYFWGIVAPPFIALFLIVITIIFREWIIKIDTLYIVAMAPYPFLILMFVSGKTLGDYTADSFLKECGVRCRLMKHRNYFPTNKSTINYLNSIVKMVDGKLYRQYQFINAEKSGTDHVTVQLPKEAYIIRIRGGSIAGRELPKENDVCMFNELSKYEMFNLILPIKQYHEKRERTAEINREEAYTNKQSEINRSITSDDINDLPLFKSLQDIAKKTEKDIEQYNRDMKSNVKENQDIAEKIKEQQ